MFTNGDDQVSNREGTAYDDAQQAVETMIMSTFDVNGGWATPDQVASSSLSRLDVVARQRRGRERSRAHKMPCGLPKLAALGGSSAAAAAGVAVATGPASLPPLTLADGTV